MLVTPEVLETPISCLKGRRVSQFHYGAILAEEVGFEPTRVISSQMLSRQRRYDRFGTPPYKNSLTSCLGREITLFRE
jgi:hypothetical protein